MADNALLELISKNYTGDAEGYEKDIVSISSILKEEVLTQKVPEEVPQEEKKVKSKKETGEEKKEDIKTEVVDENRKLTKEEADDLRQGEKDYREAIAFIKDAIAPSMMKVDATKVQI